MNTACNLASPAVTAEQLRQQLDSLHKEADSTRTKASNARMRLIRLSEAVEKLRRQAAVSVQTGKENEARELLFQKKKVMQAMEKLMTRIELFDQLYVKLNEAISTKETLLVGNMSLDLDVSDTEAPSPVRIVSPTEEDIADDDNPDMGVDHVEFGEDQEETQVSAEIHAENDYSSLKDSFSTKISIGADNDQDLRETSPYEDFMTHLDQQLNKIEEELKTFLRVSNLLLGSKERPEYSKVQHATEILEAVYHVRARIATIKQTK